MGEQWTFNHQLDQHCFSCYCLWSIFSVSGLNFSAQIWRLWITNLHPPFTFFLDFRFDLKRPNSCHQPHCPLSLPLLPALFSFSLSFIPSFWIFLTKGPPWKCMLSFPLLRTCRGRSQWCEEVSMERHDWYKVDVDMQTIQLATGESSGHHVFHTPECHKTVK